jgi:hypothetical protein
MGRTRIYYSNCLLAMRYLQVIGKVDRIKRIRNGHYIGQLRRSRRWCHFKALNQNMSRFRTYFLFAGRFEVLPRKRLTRPVESDKLEVDRTNNQQYWA